MKNVTLSFPDDLLAKSRQYAKEHNISLNQMIRDILAKYVKEQETSKKLIEKSQAFSVNEPGIKWNRDEIYDR